MHFHQFSQEAFRMLQLIIEQGGYWVLFCVTMVEGIPIVGSLVPGQTLIAIAGFLSHVDVLSPIYVTAVALIGSVIGDVFGYLLGKRYGYDSLVKTGKYFFLSKEHVEKARDLVARHTGKAIFIGRLSPMTRSLMPFLIGTSGVRARRFWMYDILSCILWVLMTVVVGYAFGASYVAVTKTLGELTVIGLIAVGLLVWGYEFINSRAHSFRRYELGTLVITSVALYGFFLTLQDVLRSPSFLAKLDVAINLFVADNLTVFANLATLTSILLSPYLLLSLSAIFCLYLLLYRRWTRAFLIVSSMGGGLFLGAALKLIIGRFRPENALLLLPDYSFPSQHVLMASAFFYLVIFFFARHVKGFIKRELFIVACCAAILLVGAARLSLNVHWFSDVLAGISIGIFWTGVMILVMRVIERGLLNRR